MFVREADPATGYTWINNLNTIPRGINGSYLLTLDWTGRFTSSASLNTSWGLGAEPWAANTGIDDLISYKYNYGFRTISPLTYVPNGITSYSVGFIIDKTSGGKDLPLPPSTVGLNTSNTYQIAVPSMPDGSAIVIWLECNDISGGLASEKLTINVDVTPTRDCHEFHIHTQIHRRVHLKVTFRMCSLSLSLSLSAISLNLSLNLSLPFNWTCFNWRIMSQFSKKKNFVFESLFISEDFSFSNNFSFRKIYRFQMCALFPMLCFTCLNSLIWHDSVSIWAFDEYSGVKYLNFSISDQTLKQIVHSDTAPVHSRDPPTINNNRRKRQVSSGSTHNSLEWVIF